MPPVFSAIARRPLVALAAGIATLGGDTPQALAQPGECRVIELEMLPTSDLQIVAWLEEPDGTYVSTLFITDATGWRGLGNRPGIMEFNSGPLWPYGRRTTTFPVWARRHGMTFPKLTFQDGVDNQLSHALGQSSNEDYYCDPIAPDEPDWDAQSCASTIYTDKGVLSDTEISFYPPRGDVRFDANKDDPSVIDMAQLNPFDAVSHATPPGELPFTTTWAVPSTVANGAYVLWVEVSREFDQNEHYDYPSPVLPSWGQYGVAYRGQPSLVYRAEMTLTEERTTATTLDYVGYGDPDGEDGELRPPDATITTDTDGSGALRLLVVTDAGDPYRIKVSAFPSADEIAPEAATDLVIEEVTGTQVSARFRAPGDDGLEGTVAGYEVRYMVGEEITAANFYDGIQAKATLAPVLGGESQSLAVTELLPRTRYSIGVRAYDECENVGPLLVFEVTTPRPQAGEVDACFVATAAYGSLLASEVRLLRTFRDVALRSHIAGELMVESYYLFGPMLAKTIAPSETLRRAARAALAPLVSRVRAAR